MAVNTVITAGARQVSFQLDYLIDNPGYRPPKEVMDASVAHADRGAFRGRVVAIAGFVLGGLGLLGVIAAGNIISGALIAIALVGMLYCYFCREAGSSLRTLQAKHLEEANLPFAKKAIEIAVSPS